MTSTLRFVWSSVLPCSILLALGVTSLELDAQSPRQASSVGNGKPAQADLSPKVFPKAMLPVPGGTIQLGTTAKELLETQQRMHRINSLRVRDIPRLMSELGPTTVILEPFFMGKNLVTMEQYKIFVEKTGHRFPFDWWRYGCEDDYEKRGKEIIATIKETENKGLLYWMQNWKNLPWKIPVDKDRAGQPSMEQYPVVYVNWRDAVAFAGWAGMRLPAEAEWMFAASGGQDREFVWGDELDAFDVKRGIRNNKPWPVGHWGEQRSQLQPLAQARGAFGHEDLVLQVWEWTGDPGFFSFDSAKFAKERERLFKDSLFKDKQDRDVKKARAFWPTWSGNDRVCKGGWYASEKSELRIATRAPKGSHQTQSGLGFRLAKSLQPGRDIAASWIRLDYDYSYFGGDRKPNLDGQLGIERYDLSKDGRLILGYHAVSLVPVNWASEDRKSNKAKLLASTMVAPVVLGTLIVTEKVEEPALDSGVYTLTYRQMGMPKVLQQALVTAARDLKAEAKAKAAAEKAAKRGRPVKEGDPKKKDDKASAPWRAVLKKYGITDEEALAGNVDFIRLKPGDLKVTTTVNLFVMRNNLGEYVSSVQAPFPLDAKAGYKEGEATVKVESIGGKETVMFEFGIPVLRGSNRAYIVKFRMKLPKESVGGGQWRLPENP